MPIRSAFPCSSRRANCSIEHETPRRITAAMALADFHLIIAIAFSSAGPRTGGAGRKPISGGALRAKRGGSRRRDGEQLLEVCIRPSLIRPQRHHTGQSFVVEAG